MNKKFYGVEVNFVEKSDLQEMKNLSKKIAVQVELAITAFEQGCTDLSKLDQLAYIEKHIEAMRLIVKGYRG